MSKASHSHTLNLSRRHLTVGAAIRDEVRRVRHQLRREAQRHGKRAWLAAAASGLCLTIAVSLAPAPAMAAAWNDGSCGTDSNCERLTMLACFAGDAAACEVMHELHREACADTPEHDDCAVFAAAGQEG